MAEQGQGEQVTQDTPDESEVYEGNVYNLWISFNNCTISNLEVRQYGKPPVKDPPPGGG
jgi:hypothetical protein